VPEGAIPFRVRWGKRGDRTEVFGGGKRREAKRGGRNVHGAHTAGEVKGPVGRRKKVAPRESDSSERRIKGAGKKVKKSSRRAGKTPVREWGKRTGQSITLEELKNLGREGSKERGEKKSLKGSLQQRARRREN